MTAKGQPERFIETAREIDIDESGEAFDVAVKSFHQTPK